MPDHPNVELSNDAITVRVLLPDATKGYYRAARFDWSGQVAEVRLKDHTFISPWTLANEAVEPPKPHDPLNTRDGAGTAEEFRLPVGYDEAQPGGGFVKVGVGVLAKPDAGEYQFARAYEFKQTPQWSVTKGPRSVAFEQTLTTDFGYGYVYAKKVELADDENTVLITHSLKNTGKKRIVTNTYPHNFFQLDSKPAGPGYALEFTAPIAVKGETKGWVEATREALLVKHQFGGTDSFGVPLSVFDGRLEFTLRHSETNAKVRVTGNQRLASFYVWITALAVCGEPMIDIDALPGETARWHYRYTFTTTARAPSR